MQHMARQTSVLRATCEHRNLPVSNQFAARNGRHHAVNVLSKGLEIEFHTLSNDPLATGQIRQQFNSKHTAQVCKHGNYGDGRIYRDDRARRIAVYKYGGNRGKEHQVYEIHAVSELRNAGDEPWSVLTSYACEE